MDWQAWWKWRPSMAVPMTPLTPTMGMPVFSWLLSHATIRLAIIPVAVLLGGIRASSGLLQRSHELPGCDRVGDAGDHFPRHLI